MGSVGSDDGRSDTSGAQGDQEIEVEASKGLWVKRMLFRQPRERSPGAQPHLAGRGEDDRSPRPRVDYPDFRAGAGPPVKLGEHDGAESDHPFQASHGIGKAIGPQVVDEDGGIKNKEPNRCSLQT